MISEDDFLRFMHVNKVEITLTAIQLILSAYSTRMSEEELKHLLLTLRKEIIEDYKQMGKIGNKELNPLLFFSEN